MNAKVFGNWFAKVLLQLEDQAVIVMDNAVYHSRKIEKNPTAAWKKQGIKDWLVNKNIEGENDLLKAELLQIAKEYKPAINIYAVDEIAKAQKKLIVRLPPYHCELNPIELIWAEVKDYVAAKNITFKFADVKNLFTEFIARIDSEKWRKCVQHIIEKVETKFLELDSIIEVPVKVI